MKRSRSVHLALMASGAVALTACDDTPAEPQVPVSLYHSVQQCAAEGTLSQDECQQAFDEALKEHQVSAPRFATQRLCEDEFDQTGCQYRAGPDGGFWMPFFMGYVVSNVIDGIGDAVSGRRRYASPAYYTSNRVYRTPSGAAVSATRGGLTISRPALTAPPMPAKVQTRTTVISRSGFGGSRSTFGG